MVKRTDVAKGTDVAKVWEASLQKATKMALADPRGRQGRSPPLGAKEFFHFHAVKDQNFLYYMLITARNEVGARLCFYRRL